MVFKMKKIDFSIQDTTPRNKKDEFVLLQAGKGKAKYSSIYVHPSGFSYIEGLIWDKFREFNRQKKSKILSNEWERILDGFKLAVEQLKDSSDIAALKHTLKFDLSRPKYSLEYIVEEQENLIVMINEVIEWLAKFVTEEKYIYISYLN